MRGARFDAVAVVVRSVRCASVVVSTCGRVAVPVVVGGRITAVVVVVVVGVVHRVHRRRRSVVVTMSVTSGRGHRRTEAVVVEAVAAGARVVVRDRRCRDDHPALEARAVPVDAERLEVFESGEAVKLAIHFVVRHDGERAVSTDAVGRDVDGDSLDASRIDLDVLLGVVVAVVGVKVDVYITPIGVVSDVLHVVVDRDRTVVVHHHRL